jgi:hypothetical protein
MSDRHIPQAELQASRKLDVTIAKKLPALLAKLPSEVARSVSDAIYDQIGAPGGRVPAEIILGRKYRMLVESGHIAAFTDAEIVEANRKDIKEVPV